MTDKSDTDRRDAWWLDDVTSLALVGLVVLALAGLLAGGAYLAISGGIDPDITVDVQFTGTVPVGTLLMGAAAGIAWMVYIAFTDIYGREDVQQATEDVQDLSGGDDQ